MDVANTACEKNYESGDDDSSNHDSDDDVHEKKPSTSRNQVLENTSVISGNPAGRPISHGMIKEYEPKRNIIATTHGIIKCDEPKRNTMETTHGIRKSY